MCDLCKENGGEPTGCQNCGCLICFDVKNGDDVLQAAYVTMSGDLYCRRCGSGHDAAEEEQWGENYDPFDDYISDMLHQEYLEGQSHGDVE